MYCDIVTFNSKTDMLHSKTFIFGSNPSMTYLKLQCRRMLKGQIFSIEINRLAKTYVCFNEDGTRTKINR